MPSVLACTPTRCSADTAFGDAYSTRALRVEQDHAVADAGRLLGLERSSLANGNSPAAIMRAKRLKTST